MIASRWCGKYMAYASKPNTPPDAPSVGYGEPKSAFTPSCASAAVRTETKYSVT